MRFIATVGFATLAAATGCTDKVCNDIGFVQGLTFSIDSGPAPADYQMQVEHESGLLLLDYSVLDDGHVQCVEGCADIDDTLRIGPMYYDEASFRSDLMYLTIQGTPDWKELPSEVHLKIFRDAVLVHDEVHAAVYQHSEPWGEGCGEGIRATFDVTLPR